jgi:cytochrome c
MKRLLSALVVLFLPTSAVAEDGAKLFTSKACTACHHAEKDQSSLGLGPSVKMIKEAYSAEGKGGAEGVAKFLNGEGKPIVKPELYPVMQAQVAMTKAMTPEQRKALAEYLMK